MIRRFLIGTGYGVIGLIVAAALTIGTSAIAGQDLGIPARPIGAGKALTPSRSTLHSDKNKPGHSAQSIHLDDLPDGVTHAQLIGEAPYPGNADANNKQGTGGSDNNSGSGGVVVSQPALVSPSPDSGEEDSGGHDD